jgi:hypothetical protein
MTSHPSAARAAAANCLVLATLVALMWTPGVARAARFSVDLWTGRGSEAVYKPGEAIDVGFHVSEEAHLLVYEIDAEGYVHVLFPHRRGDDFVPGGRDLSLPDDGDNRLVVEGPVGEGYIVAIASIEPFEPLPWYLRPADPQGDEIGYYGDREEQRDEQGITAEGRIVGDPFVAMERIRRQVVADAEDRTAFATDYTTYYVHNAVKYPRYICYDCHRPGRWSWWDGFDPYYSSCRVVDFRINVAWGWGPSYWFGYVPYYSYIYRHDCPPRYLPGGAYAGGWCGSSWDGWSRWRHLWNDGLRRFKTAPPPGYVSPAKYDDPRRWKSAGDKPLPPGFLASAHERSNGSTPRRSFAGSTGGGASDRSPWVGSRTRRDGGGSGDEASGIRKPRTETPSGRSGRADSDAGSGWERARRGNGGSDRAPRPNDGGSDNPSRWSGRGDRTPRNDDPKPREWREAPRQQEAPRRNDPPPQFREAPRQQETPRRNDPPPQFREAPRQQDTPRRESPPPPPPAPRNEGSNNGEARRQRNDPPRSEAPRSERSGGERKSGWR